MYLKITNKGLLPIRLLSLIGASTKSTDASKIGEFGTGLKYAITYFIRNNIKFKLFIGEKEVVFSTKKSKIAKNEFNEIKIAGRATGITTQYGFQWKAWEAIREVWCNALDEKIATKTIIEDTEIQKGIRNSTTFYIEMTEAIAGVVNNWNTYFIQEEPLFSNEDYAIYLNNDNKLKLYKNTVLISIDKYYKSIFRYDFKKTSLNELREYKGFAQADIARALLNSNKDVINILLNKFKSPDEKKDNSASDTFEGFLELRLDYSYTSDIFEPKLKEIFEGYYFLNPKSSTKGASNRAIKVNQFLFDILQNANLPCEEIGYSKGGYYGGGGYSGSGRAKEEIGYKIVKNALLKEKIDTILTKHNETIQYSIAVPLKEDFEFIKDDKENVFFINSSLEILNNKDLEVVIIMILIVKKEESIYNVMKRLIKETISHKHANAILFNQKQ